MRSFGSLVISTLCSVILVISNTYSFYDKFTTGGTYYGSGANKGYIQKNNEDSYRNRSLRC
ncbi:hypothetical protein COA08_27700 [Bacillus cereus]|uniref:Uncharacterized protein n=1 Tax=Bacillus cereus TaxID=1396 RepID=A0A2B8SVT1_BACCE|nr:hypothetical protein CON06_30365 [Bacillus cereus]PFM28188.1 hypothetical protein COJ43_30905 [Bacillus cereus]PGL58439.1 hypothetical protein CN927_20355 [Bacillus cereus]PGQ05116.1 hypothetical protein COA08_27700 [Bacillus cereus]